MWLVHKSSGAPSFYGIRARDPRGVSAGDVRGMPAVPDFAAAKATGWPAELIGGSRPVDDVGHSITI